MAVEVFIEADFSLNPHVVGRFFRGISWFVFRLTNNVLIPMWWGGFSESGKAEHRSLCTGLNPHVVGRFFRGRTYWHY